MSGLPTATDALGRHARARPHQAAVIDPRGRVDFASLNREVEMLACRLGAAGVTAGTPVLVLLDVRAESVVAYWALRALGAVVVVGDPTGSASDLAHCLSVTGARHVLAGLRAAQLAVPDGIAWHQLEPAATGHARWRLADAPASSSGDAGDLPPGGRPLREGGAPPAVILFSSGTTGRPKAIVHDHASLLALHESLRITWQLSPADRVLGALPFHTVYGLIFSAASTLHAGATLVLVDRFSPARALTAIRDHRVTTAAMVPAMLLMILDFDGRHALRPCSLRMVYTASAPISEADVARFSEFIGAPTLANYGMTEIPGAAVERADRPHRSGHVGTIAPGFEVCARDASGRPLPPGEIGELSLRGPSMMQGYLGDPGQTAERIRDGWIHTQDLGRVDASGNIQLTGRTSEMIIRGGLNISPLEIEDVLARHDDVADAAAIGIPHAVLGEIVCACVVLSSGATRTAAEERIARHCREHLAEAKVPARIVLMGSLPRNAGGKILRRALRGHLEAETDATTREAP